MNLNLVKHLTDARSPLSSSAAWLDSPNWRRLAWGGMVVQLAALAFVMWLGKWGGAWGIGGFFLLNVVLLLARRDLPSFLTFLAVVAAILNVGGWAWDWFERIIWYDEFIHFIVPFAIMAALSVLAWRRDLLTAEPGSADFIVMVAVAGLALGFLWEVAESFGIALRLTDTVVDLVLDTLGSVLAGWFAAGVLRRSRA